MKKRFVKKLNEDDILEILIEHFQKKKYSKSEGYMLSSMECQVMICAL